MDLVPRLLGVALLLQTQALLQLACFKIYNAIVERLQLPICALSAMEKINQTKEGDR